MCTCCRVSATIQKIQVGQGADTHELFGLVWACAATPSRAISLVSVGVKRLREITAASLQSSSPSPSPSLLSLSTFRQAIPPSLLLTSIFPHLASSLHPPPSPSSESHPSFATSSSPSSSSRLLSRQTRRLLLFLTLSPLFLTRQEIATKRAKINSAREHLARQLGKITLSINEPRYLGGLLSESNRANKLDGQIDLNDLEKSTSETLALLIASFPPGVDEPLESESEALPTPNSPPPRHELVLHHLLSTLLPSQISSFQSTYSQIRRPSLLTRSWPYLITVPLTTLVLARTIYNGRETIVKWASTAKDTVRGFVWDWVVLPVKGILETLRHGEETLALMGKDSLRSDLEVSTRFGVGFDWSGHAY